MVQQGYKEEALVVSRDLDQKFELALELKKLSVAKELLETIQKEEKDNQSTDTQQKWRKLGDLVSRGLRYGHVGLVVMVVVIIRLCGIFFRPLLSQILHWPSNVHGRVPMSAVYCYFTPHLVMGKDFYALLAR